MRILKQKGNFLMHLPIIYFQIVHSISPMYSRPLCLQHRSSLWMSNCVFVFKQVHLLFFDHWVKLRILTFWSKIQEKSKINLQIGAFILTTTIKLVVFFWVDITNKIFLLPIFFAENKLSPRGMLKIKFLVGYESWNR